MATYWWKHNKTGTVTATMLDQCPTDHSPHTPGFRPGDRLSPPAVRVPMTAMDGAAPAFDAAGASPMLRDANSVTTALAAAPARTRDLRDKAARAMMEAEGTPHDTAFGSALDTLNAVARRYQTHAFAATDAGEKAALEAAAQAVSGFASAKLAMRRPSPGQTPGFDRTRTLDAKGSDAATAHGEMKRALSDGWKSTGTRA